MENKAFCQAASVRKSILIHFTQTRKLVCHTWETDQLESNEQSDIVQEISWDLNKRPAK